MGTLRVAAAQLASGRDVDANLAEALAAIDAAADAGARLVALPEATMVSFESRLAPHAQPLDGPFCTALRERAHAREVVVVAGVFEPAADGRVHNTLLVTGPGVEASYRKVHLYDAFGGGESRTVAPGEEYVTVEALGTTIGLATCYDVRFADQFTELGRRGARLVLLPASWSDGPGKAEQWDLLTRARAADAQAWLLAAGQAWRPESVRGPLGIGRSVVVDPYGQARARLDGSRGLLVHDIDLDAVTAARETIPLLS